MTIAQFFPALEDKSITINATNANVVIKDADYTAPAGEAAITVNSDANITFDHNSMGNYITGGNGGGSWIEVGDGVTFNLNNKFNLTGTTVNGGDGGAGIKINGNANVTISDESGGFSGITFNGGSSGGSGIEIAGDAEAKISFGNGNIQVKGGNGGGNGITVNDGASVEIDGKPTTLEAGSSSSSSRGKPIEIYGGYEEEVITDGAGNVIERIIKRKEDPATDPATDPAADNTESAKPAENGEVAGDAEPDRNIFVTGSQFATTFINRVGKYDDSINALKGKDGREDLENLKKWAKDKGITELDGLKANDLISVGQIAAVFCKAANVNYSGDASAALKAVQNDGLLKGRLAGFRVLSMNLEAIIGKFINTYYKK